MIFSLNISGGRALSIAIVMTALATMLMAGGVPLRSPSCSFLCIGRFWVHSAINLSLLAYSSPCAAIFYRSNFHFALMSECLTKDKNNILSQHIK